MTLAFFEEIIVAKNSPRECGSCTACCQGWLRVQVGDVIVKPGSPCPQIHSNRCSVYENRPTTCADFNCAWLINDLDYPDWMRPDNAKVILKYIDLVSSISAIGAIPTGTKVSPRVLNFLRQLANQHGLPVLHFQRTKEQGRYLPEVAVTAFGPPGMEHLFSQIQEKIERIEYMGAKEPQPPTRPNSDD